MWIAFGIAGAIVVALAYRLDVRRQERRRRD